MIFANLLIKHITTLYYMKKHFTKLLFLLIVFCSTIIVIGQNKSEKHIIEHRENAKNQLDKPYVVLISIDGFRFDYTQRFKTAFIDQFAKQGVSAPYMLPCYPSATFANHYSIVTGLYPSHHGVVGNNMYDANTNENYSIRNSQAVKDSKWYGGTPLWVLAQEQGMLSACYFWPGSEADIKQTRPTYYYDYNETITINQRIDELVNWLELPKEKRPHLITFYLPEVDQAGHLFGPNSPITALAAQYIDLAVEKLVDRLSETGLPINFIILSDHGMLALSQEKLLSLPTLLDNQEINVVENGSYLSVFVKDKKHVGTWFDKLVANVNLATMNVYMKDDLPANYHFSTKDDYFNRIGDILITAKAPYYFTKTRAAGAHGYDPLEVKEMQAMFIAKGVNIKSGIELQPFENIDVYPFVASLLGLKIGQKIDGSNYLINNATK